MPFSARVLAVLMSSASLLGCEQAKTEPTFDYGPKRGLVAQLRSALEKEPCDRTKAVQYIQTVFSAGDWRGSIQFADDFSARCGKFPQLRSISYSAHMQLSEFDLAIRDATELIDSAPGNAGYWVWRAMAHQSREQSEQALGDFQQAFRLQPEQFQVANQLATAYERLDRPCEGHLVMLEHQQSNIESLGRPEVTKRIAQLAAMGCESGKGKAVVPVSKTGTMWVEPLVNGKTRGRFILDTGANSVAISQAFADRLGLKLEGARKLSFHTAKGLIQAPVVRVPSIALQGAQAENVEVAVMSTLPPDVDGLLGLGFLARFEMRLDAQAGRLELTERKR
ncbi:TIGR02281 family clan AA aspartic protease [Archangium lansingense]|uniref:TIGR02281 family clan AA aspartic protease n=1 Tax=Archangium lansingense TaxID=2995310 RepID=A0ABT4AH16_9BACT|nr:TIGR02281 family clan AA aspartic protease [Archangium lansinium]MCY1080972.1 TIGR02281 family clan AA aspartic protease [Archangium lansinium]